MLSLVINVCFGGLVCIFFFFKQKTAYELRISDWSSDVCSSDLTHRVAKDRLSIQIGRKIRAYEAGQFLGHVGPHLVMLCEWRLRCIDIESRAQPKVIGSCGIVGDVFAARRGIRRDEDQRSEEHTSALQSLMRISYAPLCL